jgi:hypothetical protein
VRRDTSTLCVWIGLERTSRCGGNLHQCFLHCRGRFLELQTGRHYQMIRQYLACNVQRSVWIVGLFRIGRMYNEICDALGRLNVLQVHRSDSLIVLCYNLGYGPAAFRTVSIHSTHQSNVRFGVLLDREIMHTQASVLESPIQHEIVHCANRTYHKNFKVQLLYKLWMAENQNTFDKKNGAWPVQFNRS